LQSLFPKGSLAVWLRDVLGEVFSDELLAEAFPADGRLAISPGALAKERIFEAVMEVAATRGLLGSRGRQPNFRLRTTMPIQPE
jgi:hypothetical protein